ncbi:alpha/beta hydrolase [Bifidobacterium thermophilum]|uniref:alpha/beta hydrolase family protein n=1 Tax=Bifidobacterium thermophilum TaxID=33905 RepID=UPI00309C586F
MNDVSNQEEQTAARPAQQERQIPQRQTSGAWSRVHRLAVNVPIFIILLGILVGVSHITAVSANIQPTGQTMSMLSSDTSVTFDNTTGATLPKQNTYKVTKRYITINAKRPSTGEIQKIRVLIREPEGAGGNRPGVVFMHGAGYGTCDNSFGDVAYALSSAGFVTAVIDKPVWSTNDITRDYPASAKIYDQTINYLRSLDQVDAGKVGIYATSESTWISSYLLQQDPKIAFQVLLSPMVFSPRQSLGFLASQDFTLVGAHDGYQSIVRRVFDMDGTMFGLKNFDLDIEKPAAYSIPTFVAYGSKDVMTAQVEGARKILDLAHQAGNWDVTIRSYPVANHVLRLGNEADAGTGFADDYVKDMVAWTVGTAAGLKQTSERAAGSTLYQSIAVPKDLHADRGLTVYGAWVHIAMLVTLLLTMVIALVALVKKLVFIIRRKGPALGFTYGFGGALLSLTITTLATLLLFGGGFGQVVMGIVLLAWGGAPTDDPGMMYWSWPVIQVVCTLVVWAWSRVFARLIEVAQTRGIVRIPPSKGAIDNVVSGREPVLASTRLARVLFWVTAFAMFHVLLFFAFWGLFIY